MSAGTDKQDQGPKTTGGRWAKAMLPLVALAFVAAACGGDEEDKGIATGADAVATETSADSSETTISEQPDSGTTETSAADDSEDDSTTTASTDPDADDPDASDPDSDDPDTGDNDLPGEEIELFVEIGDVLGVVGVADDDTLNVRSKPGTDQDVLTTVGPAADNLVGTGRARSLPSSIWYEVSVDGSIGWVNSSFVAFIGGTDDATVEYLDGGTAPGAETMTDLGMLVAEGFASEDPPSTIVQTVAPVVGDLGEVTYDVVGLGDDALLGYRLHIFATEDVNGETFTLRNIERTFLCTRGLVGEACT